MNHNDEELISKIMIVLFIIELIGIILVLYVKTTYSPISLSEFNTLSHQVNSTSTGLASSFNATLLSPVAVVSAPVAKQLDDLYNGFVVFVNIVYKFISLIIGLFALIFLMITLMGYVLLILIPTLLTSTGIIGYILSIGYGFILIFLAYKFGKIIYDFVLSFVGFIQGFIP